MWRWCRSGRRRRLPGVTGRRAKVGRTESVPPLLRLHQPRVLVGFEEAVQVADTGRVTHLAERFRLDLANTLAGDAELAAHFFQRAAVAID